MKKDRSSFTSTDPKQQSLQLPITIVNFSSFKDNKRCINIITSANKSWILILTSQRKRDWQERSRAFDVSIFLLLSWPFSGFLYLPSHWAAGRRSSQQSEPHLWKPSLLSSLIVTVILGANQCKTSTAPQIFTVNALQQNLLCDSEYIRMASGEVPQKCGSSPSFAKFTSSQFDFRALSVKKKKKKETTQILAFFLPWREHAN